MKLTTKNAPVLIFGILCSLFFSSQTASAYFTTYQEAVAIPGGGSLFLLEYSFGMQKKDVYLPIRAERTTVKSDSVVSYSILDDEGNEVEGTASAIILSNAVVAQNELYKVNKGAFAQKFTLVSVFIPKDKSGDKKYRLLVNHLPFNFDGVQQLQLNPSELQYYTTKYIK